MGSVKVLGFTVSAANKQLCAAVVGCWDAQFHMVWDWSFLQYVQRMLLALRVTFRVVLPETAVLQN